MCVSTDIEELDAQGNGKRNRKRMSTKGEGNESEKSDNEPVILFQTRAKEGRKAQPAEILLFRATAQPHRRVFAKRIFISGLLLPSDTCHFKKETIRTWMMYAQE